MGARGHPHLVVDVDRLPGGQADGLQAEIVRVGAAADGDEQLIAG